MAQFLNRPIGLESTIRTVVKQTFPFASPSELTLNLLDSGFRGGGDEFTVKVSGSRRERFVWGSSRMGSSRLVG